MKNILDDFAHYGHVSDPEVQSAGLERRFQQDISSKTFGSRRSCKEIARDLEVRQIQIDRNNRLRAGTGTHANRYVVLRNAGFRCQACGTPASETQLHLDHIKPKSTHPHLASDPDNYQVLCAPCNQAKGNRFEDDLRNV